MNKEIFQPDIKKDIFTITLVVHENGQTMSISVAPGEKVTYQEVIGAIEIQRMNLIMQQSANVMEAWTTAYKKSQRAIKNKQPKNQQP